MDSTLWPLVLVPVLLFFFGRKVCLCMPQYGKQPALRLGFFSFVVWLTGTLLFLYARQQAMIFKPIDWFSAVAPAQAPVTFTLSLLTYYGLLLLAFCYLFHRFVLKKTTFSRILAWYTLVWMSLSFGMHIILTSGVGE